MVKSAHALISAKFCSLLTNVAYFVRSKHIARPDSIHTTSTDTHQHPSSPTTIDTYHSTRSTSSLHEEKMYYYHQKNYTVEDDEEDELFGPPPPTDEEYDILHPLPVQKITNHPALIPARTMRGRKVTHEVLLGTVELSEMILEKLDIKTLLFAQRVCHNFRACIRTSVKLQNLLSQHPWDRRVERADFCFNNLLFDPVKTARKLGLVITRHARGNSGLWEFRVWITTPLLIKPPIGSSLYAAGLCTKGYKCLAKGEDLWEEDQHIIKVYFKDTQALDRPFVTIATMEPDMGIVYQHFEYTRPNMIIFEEELDDGFTLGGNTRARFMHGRARQAAIIAKDEERAEKVRMDFREWRAKSRAGKLAELSSDDPFA